MKKGLITFLVLIASQVFRGGFTPYRRSFMDLARLKTSMLYLKGIETSRYLFISLLGIGGALVFLLCGLILLPATLFLYATWSVAIKLTIGLLFSLLYLSIAGWLFSYVFSEEKWLKIFHADTFLSNLTQNSPEAESEPAADGNGKAHHKKPAESFQI